MGRERGEGVREEAYPVERERVGCESTHKNCYLAPHTHTHTEDQ